MLKHQRLNVYVFYKLIWFVRKIGLTARLYLIATGQSPAELRDSISEMEMLENIPVRILEMILGGDRLADSDSELLVI